MSHNNNYPQSYSSRYSSEGSFPNNSNQFSHFNSNTYQSGESLPTANPSPLLPYHEYMALKNKSNLSAQKPSETISQTSAQQYPMSEPYLYPNSTYQNQSYAPNPSRQHDYAPLQPYNTYMQQKQQLTSLPQSQPYVELLQSPKKANSFSSAQRVQANISNSISEPKQTPEIRHSPTPMNKAQFNHKQQQYKPFNHKNIQEQRPFKHNNHSSPQKFEKKQQNSQNTKNYNKVSYDRNYGQRNQEDDYNMNISSDGWSSEEEEEQILYQKYQSSNHKSKPIHKKKDPVVDNPEEIRKWIEARKRNYPGLRKRLNQQSNPSNEDEDQKQRQIEKEKQEMSKLQAKIRKKIVILNGDSRSLMKKIKNIEILKRIVQNPRILTRQRKPYGTQGNQDKKHKQFNQTEKKVLDSELKPKNEPNLIQQEGQAQQDKIVAVIPLQMNPEQQKGASSQSQESIEPEELPANKIPTQQAIIFTEQLIQDNNKPLPQLFQVIPKSEHPSVIQITQIQAPQKATRRQPKSLDPQSIIAHLRQKQQQDRQSLDKLFDYKSNSYSYNYRVQTLQTSLKLDQIFAESTYLLQAVRYIAKENFFD